MASSLTIIYDDACGFCSRSVRISRRLDWLHNVDWRPRSDANLKKDFPQVPAAGLNQRMVGIHKDGRILEGFFAWRSALVRFPLTFLPGLLLFVPGVPLLGQPVYDWVARNRAKLGGAVCPAEDRK